MSQTSGPLNISLNTDEVKTQVPKFVEGNYIKVRFAKLEQDEVPQKGTVLKFQYDLVDPTPDQEGQTILPGQMGSKIFESVQLYDKNTKPGDPAPKWAMEKIGKRLDGFLGTGDAGNTKGKPTRPKLSPETVTTLIGQVAFMKFKNKTGDYDGQDISEVKFPGDMPQA